MKNFFKSAGFLAFALVLSKILGAFFKVPLVRLLGGEGMGVYQLVFPIYTVTLTLASGGTAQAVSRATARAIASGDYAKSRKVLSVALRSLLIFGVLGTAVMSLTSGALSALQGNRGARLAYVALSPSVAFVALLSAIRGWWQGHGNMFPTALCELIEQSAKLIFGVLLARTFLPYGVEYGAMGAVLGVSVGEGVALVALGAYHLAKKRSQTKSKCEATSGQVFKEIYATALPIAFGALVTPLLGFIDSMTVINVLTACGMTAQNATSAYGAVSAPVSTIVNLPTAVISAICASLLPKLATGGDGSKACLQAEVIGIGCAVAIALFAREYLTFLYGTSLTPAELDFATVSLRISSIGVVYLVGLQLLSTAFQAEGRAKIPAFNLAVGSVLKAVLLPLLLMTIGVVGVAVSTVATYMLTFALDYIAFGKAYKTPFAHVTLSALIAGGTAIIFKTAFEPSTLATIFVSLVFGITYILLLFAVKVFETDSIMRAMQSVTGKFALKTKKD